MTRKVNNPVQVNNLIDKGFHGYAKKQVKKSVKTGENKPVYANLKGHRK